jgi:hypothetical protein
MSYDTPEGAGGGSATPPPGPYDPPGGPDAGQTAPPSGAYGSYGSYPSYGTQQPSYGAYPSYGVPPGAYGKPPPSYRGWAITCIVCGVLFSIIIGLPCALVSLNYSRKVQRAWDAGDQQGAAKASRTAMIWAIVATVFEALGLIFVITLIAHGHTSTT